MLDIKAILIELQNYIPFDSAEEENCKQLLKFITMEESVFSPTNFNGHITASAIVIDQSSSNLLIIWHEKTAKWLQPGGHCESEIDISPQSTALRELFEETAITPSLISVITSSILDIDAHIIPQWGDYPAHNHFDFKYLFRFGQTTKAGAYNNNQKWITIKDVDSLGNQALSRVSRKLLLKKDQWV